MSFILVSIAEFTGMNMIVENNMLHLLCQQIKKGQTYAFQIFSLL